MLVGAGGHCKSVLDSALKMYSFDKIVITDPVVAPGTRIYGCEVVGSDELLLNLNEIGFGQAFITVGNVNIDPLREELVEKVSSLGYKFPIIADPTAIISDKAVIGEGAFIGKGAVVNAGARIGRHCIINTGAIIEHGCEIGDYSHVSVGAVLCGEVKVGKRCMIGSGSTVIQNLKISDHCIVGAGAVVNRDVYHDTTVVGVPAKLLEKRR